MIRFRDLPSERQAALRIAYAASPEGQARGCDMADKIARFARWLEPQGVSFSADDLPGRARLPATRS